MLVFEWSRREADIARDSFFSDDEDRLGPSGAEEVPPQQ